jgi:hypothetical protein
MERVRVANFPISNLSPEYTPTENGGFTYPNGLPALGSVKERPLGILESSPFLWCDEREELVVCLFKPGQD